MSSIIWIFWLVDILFEMMQVYPVAMEQPTQDFFKLCFDDFVVWNCVFQNILNELKINILNNNYICSIISYTSPL